MYINFQKNDGKKAAYSCLGGFQRFFRGGTEKHNLKPKTLTM